MHTLSGYWFVRRLRFAFKTILRSLAVKAPLKTFDTQQGSNSDRVEAVYIINLDRQHSRWEAFRTEARRHVVEGRGLLLDFCHRVSAVDGKLLDVSEAGGSVNPTYPLDNQYYVDPDPRLLNLIREKVVHVSMSREEVAVALSHIKTWRRLVPKQANAPGHFAWLASGAASAVTVRSDPLGRRRISVLCTTHSASPSWG